MPKSYYGKTAVGQFHGVMTRPANGVNEYQPSTAINDNSLSDALNVKPYRNEALVFDYDVVDDAFICDGGEDGNILSVVDYFSDDNVEYLALLKESSGSYIIGFTQITNLYTLDEYDVSAHITGTSGNVYSGCTFNTEAKRYVVFSVSKENRIVWCDKSETGYVTVPFEPKKIISHVNRIFALDTGNKIWWCRAGDFHTWYGLEQDDDRIVTSTNMKNGAFTIAAQPDVPRPLMTTITTVAVADTLGSATAVGIANDGTALTETKALQSGIMIWSSAFKTITSFTISGWTSDGTADTIKVGIAPIGTGFAQEDQGYWTIENEATLNDLAVLNSNLFIWSINNIYVFSGYSPETFALTMMVSDVGGSEITTSQNTAYFIFNNDVYEFDGNNFPRIISHSLFTNGSVANNIYGGINAEVIGWSLTATSEYLYFYQTNLAGLTYTKVFLFNIKERSWWKLSGFDSTESAIGDSFIVKMLKVSTERKMVAVISNLITDEWLFFHSPGIYCADAGNPYIVTKAFNSRPSEDGTLTSIVLDLQGDVDYPSGITVYYSTTVNGDDFQELWRNNNYHFTGDHEQLTINTRNSEIARLHHYRLKIEIEMNDINDPIQVYLYNIERVFRTQGRSR